MTNIQINILQRQKQITGFQCPVYRQEVIESAQRMDASYHHTGQIMKTQSTSADRERKRQVTCFKCPGLKRGSEAHTKAQNKWTWRQQQTDYRTAVQHFADKEQKTLTQLQVSAGRWEEGAQLVSVGALLDVHLVGGLHQRQVPQLHVTDAPGEAHPAILSRTDWCGSQFFWKGEGTDLKWG